MKPTALSMLAIAIVFALSCMDRETVENRPEGTRRPIDARTLELADLLAPLIHHDELLVLDHIENASVERMGITGECPSGPGPWRVQVCHQGSDYSFYWMGSSPIDIPEANDLCLVVFRNRILAIVHDDETIRLGRSAIEDARISVASET